MADAGSPNCRSSPDTSGRWTGGRIASALGAWAMALLTVTLVSASLLLGKRPAALFQV